MPCCRVNQSEIRMPTIIDKDTNLEQDFNSITDLWIDGVDIPPNFFTDQRFPKLKHLSIFNLRNHIGILMIESSSLVQLMAENCGIEELSMDCPNLNGLNVSNNMIQKIDPKCPSLKYLNCCYNRLTELKLNLTSLESLSCTNNNIVKLELECPSLHTLHCSMNRLSELPTNMPFLERVGCSGNRLKNFHGLEFCSELRYLFCSENLIAEAELLRATHLPNLRIETDDLLQDTA